MCALDLDAFSESVLRRLIPGLRDELETGRIDLETLAERRGTVSEHVTEMCLTLYEMISNCYMLTLEQVTRLMGCLFFKRVST